MRFSTVAIVGVGLIGGSIGLALRRRGLADRVLGIDNQPSALEQALSRGAITEGSTQLRDAGAANLVIFCTPVDQVVHHVMATAPACRAGTILTDTGSTKTEIVGDLDGKLPPGVTFVGGHPLAGSEKQGPAHADGELFQGRVVVLTPSLGVADKALETVSAFWECLGAKIRLMTPEDHDRAMAVTSHLPHLVAASLSGVLPSNLFELTATGFRDMTRIAAGSPELWTAILQTNREAVLAALSQLETRLKDFRVALTKEDRESIEHYLKEGKRVRDALAGEINHG